MCVVVLFDTLSHKPFAHQLSEHMTGSKTITQISLCNILLGDGEMVKIEVVVIRKKRVYKKKVNGGMGVCV